jgi:galactokinase/mevalonate kinase-like predicted kinase
MIISQTPYRVSFGGGSDGDLDRFAALLHEGWARKRSLGCGISNDQVNEWYGATGRRLGR